MSTYRLHGKIIPHPTYRPTEPFCEMYVMTLPEIITDVSIELYFQSVIIGNKLRVYSELPQKFIYGKSNSINLCSKFRFKPELYDAVAEGDKESQSLYCEQPLVYSLVYLFKYYSMYGKKPFWTKIPILGSFFAALFKLFGLFEQNEAYEVESKRLRAKIMLREKNGFKILQNPLGI